jgi:putative FmdB family regulatory protein
MPIYEYTCRACGNQFEALVRGTTTPACPDCKSEDLERLLSVPGVRSETTHGLAMRDAKHRDAKRAEERVQEQRRYELSHDD